LLDKSRLERGNKCVADLMDSQSFQEVRTSISAFLKAADEVRDEYNGMFIWGLCQELGEKLVAWAEPYSAAPRNLKYNAVIIPPEHAPLMLLKSSVPINGSPTASRVRQGFR